MSGKPLHSWYGFSVGLPSTTTIDANGNVSANYAAFNNLSANTSSLGVASANSLTVSGNLTVTGNIVGNLTGKLQSPGADTWVLYTIGGNASASGNFTFNPSTNFLHVSAGNLCVDDGSITGSFIASTSGTILTVSAMLTSTPSLLLVGSFVNGPGIQDGTHIAALGTGSGGVGTYTLSASVSAIATNATFTARTNNTTVGGGGQIVAKYYWGDGSNVTNVAAKTAVNVTASAQPNITTLTNIVNLTVTSNGSANLGNIANLKIAGGATGQTIITTSTGALAWGYTPKIANGTSNISIDTYSGAISFGANGVPNIAVFNGPNATNSRSNVVFSSEIWANGNIRANYFDGDGSRLYNIAAANIVGNLSYSGSFLIIGRTVNKTIVMDRGQFSVGKRSGNVVISA